MRFAGDYLADNLARRPADRVQNAHEFVIVDEVDTILVDRARHVVEIVKGAVGRDKSAFPVTVCGP